MAYSLQNSFISHAPNKKISETLHDFQKKIQKLDLTEVTPHLDLVYIAGRMGMERIYGPKASKKSGCLEYGLFISRTDHAMVWVLHSSKNGFLSKFLNRVQEKHFSINDLETARTLFRLGGDSVLLQFLSEWMAK